MRFALLLGLVGCLEPGGEADRDLGGIDATLSVEDRPSWPGLDRASGRVIPLLGAFGEGVPSAYWFLGFGSRRTADSFWFCREGDAGCPLDAHRRLAWGALVGHPLFTRIPSDPEYSPFWQMWTVRVPAGFVPDAVKTVATLDELVRAGAVRLEPLVVDFGALFGERIGSREVVVHSPLVLAGTELEGAGAPMPDGSGPILRLERRRGWFEGHRVEVVDFSASDGVLAAAADSRGRPLARVANLYVLWRTCTQEPRAAICDLDGHATRDRRPVSERGLGQDITGDHDASDTNNVAGSAPCSLARPTERPYSPLWAPSAVEVPASAGAALIDTTSDEKRSDIASADDLFAAVDEQGFGMPAPMREDETGNPVPGNDGQVLYDCPMVVPEGFVPYPCEDDR